MRRRLGAVRWEAFPNIIGILAFLGRRVNSESRLRKAMKTMNCKDAMLAARKSGAYFGH